MDKLGFEEKTSGAFQSLVDCQRLSLRGAQKGKLTLQGTSPERANACGRSQ